MHLVVIGPSRHAAPPHDFGRKRGEADVKMVDQGDYDDAPDPLQT
jgi:hypothetical protein